MMLQTGKMPSISLIVEYEYCLWLLTLFPKGLIFCTVQIPHRDVLWNIWETQFILKPSRSTYSFQPYHTVFLCLLFLCRGGTFSFVPELVTVTKLSMFKPAIFFWATWGQHKKKLMNTTSTYHILNIHDKLVRHPDSYSALLSWLCPPDEYKSNIYSYFFRC